MLRSSAGADPHISLGETGLALGIGTRLAPFAAATDRLLVDRERLEAMFAVAFQRAPSSRDLSAIEAASTHWQRGDKALANLRLVFADLPQLDEAEDAVRLKAAELLFDAGLRADDLAKAFDADPSDGSLGKYDPTSRASRPAAARKAGNRRRRCGVASALGSTSRSPSETRTPVCKSARNRAPGQFSRVADRRYCRRRGAVQRRGATARNCRRCVRYKGQRGPRCRVASARTSHEQHLFRFYERPEDWPKAKEIVALSRSLPGIFNVEMARQAMAKAKTWQEHEDFSEPWV